MSVEENKEKIRHWFTEIVNGKADLDTFYAELDATISQEFVDHDMPNSEQGYANLKFLMGGSQPPGRKSLGQKTKYTGSRMAKLSKVGEREHWKTHWHQSVFTSNQPITERDATVHNLE